MPRNMNGPFSLGTIGAGDLAHKTRFLGHGSGSPQSHRPLISPNLAKSQGLFLFEPRLIGGNVLVDFAGALGEWPTETFAPR